MLVWSFLALVGCPTAKEVDTACAGPAVRVEPADIAFGLVPVEDDGVQTVTVHNDGCADLELTDPTLADGGAGFTVSVLGGLRVPPAGSTTFTVTYTPPSVAESVDAVLLGTNDPAAAVVEVPLSGTGEAPVLEITPASTYLGEVGLPCSETVELTVTNVGTADLVVDDLDFITASNDFSLDNPSVDPLPWTLAPGASTTFSVLYAPTDNYHDEAYVRLTSNDPFEPQPTAVVHAGALEECVP